ncbi:LytR/AlgR family response regulator transcription factor [Pontiella agarivorans]|uniref:LytTR family DNA-binding domain-containing protein n=1 Tax=Pontiella agarivorans TaxID=3038953 RepID=A0ABU5MWX4_9BACT|nr:LytTR family DNA-binding domain-containing protein [Pontiella agarivorans]MDZ8118714.1 LytTR family DNA-binding domain-containing protein [Pontiella agarivorans]
MKCLLIEDEAVALVQLKGLLQEIGNIEIVGEAADVEDGVQLIRDHPEADLLILDVELPGGTCFDIISRFNQLPKLLFVTGHEKYALSAFEVNALDYLQKPISIDRLRQALDRLDTPAADDGEKLPVLKEDDLVVICRNKYRYFIRVSEICAILSDENYTHIICSLEKRFVMKKTMTAWEQQLPGNLFYRISRQKLINISALDRLEIKERKALLWLRGIPDPLPVNNSAVKNLQKLVQPI